MHDRDTKTVGPISRLLSVFRNDDDDDIHDAHGKGNRIAVKCDLCAGYDDYACVRGCPVGAAMRVDPVELFGRDDLMIGLEQHRGIETAQRSRSEVTGN
jgi:Fe-S-cluster-containing hydrogenase component 2